MEEWCNYGVYKSKQEYWSLGCMLLGLYPTPFIGFPIPVNLFQRMILDFC